MTLKELTIKEQIEIINFYTLVYEELELDFKEQVEDSLDFDEIEDIFDYLGRRQPLRDKIHLEIMKEYVSK